MDTYVVIGFIVFVVATVLAMAGIKYSNTRVDEADVGLFILINTLGSATWIVSVPLVVSIFGGAWAVIRVTKWLNNKPSKRGIHSDEV